MRGADQPIAVDLTHHPARDLERDRLAQLLAQGPRAVQSVHPIGRDEHDVVQAAAQLLVAIRMERPLEERDDVCARSAGNEDDEAEPEQRLVGLVEGGELVADPCLVPALRLITALLAAGETREGGRIGTDARMGIQELDLLLLRHLARGYPGGVDQLVLRLEWPSVGKEAHEARSALEEPPERRDEAVGVQRVELLDRLHRAIRCRGKRSSRTG